MNKIKRPIIWITLGFIMGIIQGEMFLNKGRFLPFFSILLIGILMIIYHYYNKALSSILVISFIMGALFVVNSSLVKEGKYFVPYKSIQLEGQVEEIEEGKFNTRILLKKVAISSMKGKPKIFSKVSIQLPLSASLNLLDIVSVEGTVLPPPQKMNPSDMDYEQYLRGQNVVATVKAQRSTVISSTNNYFFRLKGRLKNQIDRIFQNKDQGIIAAILIGESKAISDHVYEVYSGVGIVHVLSISGFHIALLTGIILLLLGYLGIPYTLRYSITAGGIWAYAFLAGASMPTVRACIMATILIVARCIWEEEDAFISLALAALLLLIIRPFQVYQMGFQLSFVAVGSLFFSQVVLDKYEEMGFKKRQKLLKVVVPWLMVTLGTYPILAFNFFEVPLLCSLLNIVLIPIFSVIIVSGWTVLILSFVSLHLAIALGQFIIVVLRGIESLSSRMMEMPLGTLCVGKPTLAAILLYYGLVIMIILYLIGYIKKPIYLKVTVMSITLLIMIQYFLPTPLELTYLYVGQGDGMVMTTSQGKIIIIDGGNFGKGKTLERYIKYKGKRNVEAIIVSHSDADHIGGIIDLLKSNIKIKNIFMSKTDQSSLQEEVVDLCEKNKVKLYQIGYLDGFRIDEINIACLTPRDDFPLGSTNDNSLSCLVTYRDFSALFTGDLSKEIERRAFEGIGQVNLLKVAHHGSKTSTDEKTLLEINPNYAIISSGINNNYGHPHELVLERLQQHAIPVLRTDTKGAVMITTDGKKLLMHTQIKGGAKDAK